MLSSDHFCKSEIKLLRSLKTPAGIQSFLDRIPYHHANTAWSPRNVIRHKTAHCLEGAIFAAAALEAVGFKPLILDLEAVRDTDHVVAVFQQNKLWGSIASSNFSGLRYRAPVYKNIRELVMSYFDNYVNLRGERTLRRYSNPINLRQFNSLDWKTTEAPIWFIAEHLVLAPHKQIFPRKIEKNLTRIDKRSMGAARYGSSEKY